MNRQPPKKKVIMHFLLRSSPVRLLRDALVRPHDSDLFRRSATRHFLLAKPHQLQMNRTHRHCQRKKEMEVLRWLKQFRNHHRSKACNLLWEAQCNSTKNRNQMLLKAKLSKKRFTFLFNSRCLLHNRSNTNNRTLLQQEMHLQHRKNRSKQKKRVRLQSKL